MNLSAAESFISSITTYASNNPVLSLFLVYILIRMYFQFTQAAEEPAHIEGSLVQVLKTKEEWTESVAKAKQSGGIIVAYFYATWCPPCKRAAPIYATMSKSS